MILEGEFKNSACLQNKIMAQ